MRNIIQIVEAFEHKFAPSGSDRDLRVAHREVGKEVKKLLQEGKVDAKRVDFRTLWEQLVKSRDLEENLTSSAFPNISGEIISKVMIDAYEAFPKNGDKLVRTVPSKLKISRVAGWTAFGAVERVGERQEFPELAPMDEKSQTINNYKHGGLLSLTKEDIFFDQSGQLIDRASQVGEEAARKREELIFAAVSDPGGNSLSGADLYASGNSNRLTTNPLGTTGWETVRTNLLKKKDEKNKPIWVFGDRPFMVVPPALLNTAEKLGKNEYGDLGTANLDVNLARGQFDVIVNPYWTADDTTWWYGAFKRQFRWEEVWPVEVFMRVGQDSEDGFKKDIVQQHKCSFFGGAGAIDTKYVYESAA